jgi:hypothetical protein
MPLLLKNKKIGAIRASNPMVGAIKRLLMASAARPVTKNLSMKAQLKHNGKLLDLVLLHPNMTNISQKTEIHEASCPVFSHNYLR